MSITQFFFLMKATNWSIGSTSLSCCTEPTMISFDLAWEKAIYILLSSRMFWCLRLCFTLEIIRISLLRPWSLSNKWTFTV